MGVNEIKEIFLSNLTTIGLLCNLLGSLLVVFYISKDSDEWVESEDKPGQRWYAVYIKHPELLRLGVVLLFLGFFLQLVDNL